MRIAVQRIEFYPYRPYKGAEVSMSCQPDMMAKLLQMNTESFSITYQIIKDKAEKKLPRTKVLSSYKLGREA